MTVRHKAMRNIRTASALAAALSAILASQQVHAAGAPEVYPTAALSTTPSPKVDPFYEPPTEAALLAVAPGTILKVRPLVAQSSASKTMAAKAWHLMLRSTDHKGRAVASVATVFLPANAPATGRKVVAHNPAYDSLTLESAPSYAYVKGVALAGEQSTVQGFLDKGYVVVVSDYEGLDSLWAVGKNSGQGLLDAVRAAESFPDLGLSGSATPVAITGYSGGAIAATWANELYKQYAPELNIVGVAAGGVAVDVGNVARKVNKRTFAGLYFGVVTAYARAYPELDVNTLANDKGKAMLLEVGEMSNTTSPNFFKFINKDLQDYLAVPNLLDRPEVKAVIAENRLGQAKPGAPVYLYNGTTDQVMPYEDVVALKAKYCSQGVKVKLTGFFGEHLLTLLTAGSSVKTYVDDVFKGKVASNCP